MANFSPTFMQLQTSRSPLLPSRKISQSGPHASSAACSPQSRRWTRSSSLLQPSAASRCTSPGSLLQCCQSRPIPANPASRSLASPFSSALQESWDTPQLQDRHRGLLQLRNLLDYCPFPPPGIAALSLPDTISAPPQSQRLTPLRTASPPLPFRNCHSEGVRQGCPKNLNCKCSVDLTYESALLRRQKTIPSHPIPRTIKSWAPASTGSSRASVFCRSFFAFSRRPSAQRAAPSLPAPTPAPTSNRRPVVTIRRSIPTALPCLPAPLLPHALRRIHCSQLFPHNSSVSCLPVLIR